MTNRGIAIYNTLFNDEPPVLTSAGANTSGRNPQKIEQRNDYLAHRFYFKSKVQRKNFMDTIKELAFETWLQPFQVQKLIQQIADEVLLVKQQKPGVIELKKKWPHIVWN